MEALFHAGFVRSVRTLESVTLRRGRVEIAVPLVDALEPEELSAILRGVGIPYSEFLDFLSEAPRERAPQRTGKRRRVETNRLRSATRSPFGC